MNLRLPRMARSLLAGALVLMAVLAGAGCGGDSGEAPAALPPEKVIPETQKAFESAPPEIRMDVEAALRSLQESRAHDAVPRLNELTEQPNLSPEQRRAAGQSLQTALEQLRQAAARGDARSQQTLEEYRASK